MSRGAARLAPDVFSPSGATSRLRSDSSASAHRGCRAIIRSAASAGVEIAIADFNAKGVGELRAGQQRIGIDGRRDLADGHRNVSLLASAAEAQQQKHGIDRGSDRQPDPARRRAPDGVQKASQQAQAKPISQ